LERPVLDSVLELFDEAQPEGFDYLSEGPINLPEDSVVDTESDGYVNEPDLQVDELEESDVDQEKDEDYVMGDDAAEDEDSEVSDDKQKSNVDIKSMKGKGKIIKVIPFLPLLIHWSL
jgi:hypothetical protein